MRRQGQVTLTDQQYSELVRQLRMGKTIKEAMRLLHIYANYNTVRDIVHRLGSYPEDRKKKTTPAMQRAAYLARVRSKLERERKAAAAALAAEVATARAEREAGVAPIFKYRDL